MGGQRFAPAPPSVFATSNCMNHYITDSRDVTVEPSREGSRQRREGPATAPPEPLLGITAKSSVRQQKPTEKAGRAQRYAAHSKAREILKADALQQYPGEYPGDTYRTVDCRYVNHSYVGVNYSAAYQAAHYSGLVTCGSVWACPICASRIQERRRLEIEQALVWASREGLQALMVTFTFPHRSFNTLAELLERQARAFTLLRQTSRWRKLMKRLGFSGLIRSLEVTHGFQNGWHPHTHELWFVDPSIGTAVQLELVELWERACISAGLLDCSDENTVMGFRFHSVNVRADVSSGDYLAKQDDSRSWGISHEIAKATSKAGKAKGVHPHHFLVLDAQGDSVLFLEYVNGMKGRRQLFWSQGLKKTVNVEELADETIATDEREAADLLALLPPEVWKIIRGNDARAELLEAAEAKGFEGICLFLQALGVDSIPAPPRPRPKGD
jgi:hypothetical protein